ncbi:MAG: 2-oxo-4-hydroxy-4-carboxy-5-ureidoimidazoline decarboxylase [Deltaproteobacteria bacterium]
MLNLLESRINNSPEEELLIAQQEQQKIMLLRLNKMFEEPKK